MFAASPAARLMALLLPVAASPLVAAPQSPTQRDAEPRIAGVADYTHPIGVRFQHPDRWRVSETGLGLEVTPPDRGHGAFGPTEIHVVTIVGANDVTSLEAPAAVQFVDARVRELFPFLRREQDIKPLDGGGRRFTWTGRHPAGLDAECHVYSKLIGGYVLSISTAGERSLVRRRRPSIETMFATLTLGEPQIDPRLASTWYAKNYRTVGDVQDRINFANTQTVTLVADGSLSSSSQTAISGQTGRNNPQRPGTSISGMTEAAREAGRWAMQGEYVYMLWKTGGVTKCKVYVQGAPGRRELLVTQLNGSKSLWTEYNE
ncbi:MAG: hypothetical protein AAF628_15590 [Planctomycetota bacterium]